MKKSILIVVCVIFITGFSLQPCTANNDQEREAAYHRGMDVIDEFYRPASAKCFQSKVERYFDAVNIKSKVKAFQAQGMASDAINRELAADLKKYLFDDTVNELNAILNSTYRSGVNLKTPLREDVSITRPVTLGLAASAAAGALFSGIIGASAALTATAPSLWSAVGAYWTGSSLGAAAAATSVVSGWGLIAVGATVVGAGVAYIYGQKELERQLQEARHAITQEIKILRPILEKRWFESIYIRKIR